MKTIRFALLPAVLALSLMLPTAAQQVPPDSVALARQWADDIWLAARSGDEQTLTERFRALPQAAADFQGASRFQESLALHIANEARAITKREEARTKAQEEMTLHLASSDLTKALRAAVTMQTLTDKMETAFDNQDVQKVIAWAQKRIPEVEAELDWLSAQELLYYLRTLYEDTNRFDDFQKYRDELNAVNRRVSLLAQYAPHQLHELRAKRAERLGEKPLGEYKPNPSTEWSKRVQGIDVSMLRAALKTAATEHIESQGWRPLLKGGLEELRLLATTASLDETFPKLADEQAVKAWVNHLDAELTRLTQTPDARLDPSYCRDLLSRLDGVNQETIQLAPAVLYREFGEGALYELDEYSEIIWPDKLPRFKQATEGAFVGVGILIRHNDTQEIMVVNPLEGTPAYFGGVKPDDKIVEVDGEPTLGWSLNDAVDRITGAPNTDVTLGLEREGVEGLLPITLRRDVIKLRTVMGWWKKNLRPDGAPEWDWYIDPVTRIAYIKLNQFTDDSYSDLLDAWRQITASGKPAGLILDLRFNPGGLLTSAVQVSNLFVKSGLIVTGEDKDGKQPTSFRPQRADPTRAQITDVPVVVLINQGSASASEIVSGCLQAHGTAVIVGERSFGKGSVQTVHPTAMNARLKLTTQYYRLPPKPGEDKGRLVHKRVGQDRWGVDPDITVKMTPDQIKESQELRQKADVIPQDEKGKLLVDAADRPDVNKLLNDGLDPQLETALLILQARAIGDSVEQEMRHAMKPQ
jgi:carboxyl-terminal processing protease